MFEPYGQVDRVSIMTDRDTGRSRGFGFVEMASNEDGEKAIAALNGTQVGGRTLNVNEARPKTEHAGGGGRDRGGRGGDRGGPWGRWRRRREAAGKTVDRCDAGDGFRRAECACLCCRALAFD